MMEKTIYGKEYPQQYTWTKFVTHLLVVFILLIGFVLALKSWYEI